MAKIHRSHKNLKWREVFKNGTPHDACRRVATTLEGYLKHETAAHFSSVTKAIETAKGCVIIVEPFPVESPFEGAFLITDEVEVRYDVKTETPQIRLRNEHYIFYTPFPGDKNRERFYVARELAHCALHFPLTKTRRKRATRVEFETASHAFTIRFTAAEERETDVFASLLVAMRPVGGEQISEVSNDSVLFERLIRCRDLGYFVSAKQ